jgi:hypothetical protein
MKREFRSDRFCKLVKTLVNLLAFFSILIVLYGAYGYFIEYSDKNDWVSKCVSKGYYSLRNYSDEDILILCQNRYENERSKKAEIVLLGGICAFVIPAGVYSGAWIFNYLFPIKKLRHKRNKSESKKTIVYPPS